MPALSLVVCVHRQRDLLERLLRECAGCYDELIVEHDLPDTLKIRQLVEDTGGRFFERPPTSSQEPHWAFMWGQARYDWILRLDADEFPGEEMKSWLRQFRQAPEPPADLSGYTCVWPLWNGHRMVTAKWPAGRNFLFHKQRVRFFGMGEQVPVPDGKFQALDLILCHQPHRKSYGVMNALRAHPRGRAFIAQSLLGKPTDLVCWRWESEVWPVDWEQIRSRPLRTILSRLTLGTYRALRDQWRSERKFLPLAALGNPIHLTLVCLAYRKLRRKNSP